MQFTLNIKTQFVKKQHMFKLLYMRTYRMMVPICGNCVANTRQTAMRMALRTNTCFKLNNKQNVKCDMSEASLTANRMCYYETGIVECVITTQV